MSDTAKQKWIEDVELEDAQIKWNWSHFDGRQDTYNEEGEYNYTLVLPRQTALELLEEGWNVREREPYEEGDEPEFTLEVKISDKFGMPKMFLIKRGRRFGVEKLRELHDIKRETTTQIDVIITPSRWVNGNRTGVTAYTKELYATITESRFAEKYADLEEV